MKSQTDILQQLVKHCFFAPNAARLATTLGYVGRMNIVRLTNGDLGTRAVSKLWKDICRILSVPEAILPFLPQVWELSDSLKHTPEVLRIDLPPEEQTKPEGLSGELWRQVTKLYRQDAMLYYILSALVYAKRNGINPYKREKTTASAKIIRDIDTHLHKQ